MGFRQMSKNFHIKFGCGNATEGGYIASLFPRVIGFRTGLFRVSVKSKPYSKSGVDAPIVKSLKLPIVHLIRFHVVYDNPW